MVIKLHGIIGQYSDINNTYVERQLAKAGGRDVVFQLHSYGGQIFEGNILFNTIKAYSGKVSFEVVGVAASMATIIMLAGDKVEAVDNGYMMVHVPHSCMCGKAKDLKQEAGVLQKVEEQLKSHYLHKGVDSAVVQRWFDGEDHWMTAKQALEHGLIDGIIHKISSEDYTASKAEHMAQYKQWIKHLQSKHMNTLNQQGSYPTHCGTPPESVDNKENPNEALQQKLKALQSSMVNDLIDRAIEDGKIENKKQVRERYQTIGMTQGADFLKGMFQDIPKPPAASIVDAIHRADASGVANSADRKHWTWDEWQDKDPRGLEKMEQENSEQFEALFNAKYKTH